MEYSREDFLKKLAKHLNDVRIEKELSYNELALRSDIEKASLVRIFHGKKNITTYTLYKISLGLNKPIQDLLNLDLD